MPQMNWCVLNCLQGFFYINGSSSLDFQLILCWQKGSKHHLNTAKTLRAKWLFTYLRWQWRRLIITFWCSENEDEWECLEVFITCHFPLFLSLITISHVSYWLIPGESLFFRTPHTRLSLWSIMPKISVYAIIRLGLQIFLSYHDEERSISLDTDDKNMLCNISFPWLKSPNDICKEIMMWNKQKVNHPIVQLRKIEKFGSR